jgi:hypothetical protein
MSTAANVAKHPALSLLPGTLVVLVPRAVGSSPERGKAMAVEPVRTGFPPWPLNVRSRLTLHRPDEPHAYRSPSRAVRTTGGRQGDGTAAVGRRPHPALPCLLKTHGGVPNPFTGGNLTMGHRGDAS